MFSFLPSRTPPLTYWEPIEQTEEQMWSAAGLTCRTLSEFNMKTVANSLLEKVDIFQIKHEMNLV